MIWLWKKLKEGLQVYGEDGEVQSYVGAQRLQKEREGAKHGSRCLGQRKDGGRRVSRKGEGGEKYDGNRESNGLPIGHDPVGQKVVTIRGI